MSAGYAVPAAYMTAEVYRGTLVSKGAICPRVDEKVDGEYQLDVEIPCGAFDNVADIFNLSLSFQSGKPISLSCWLHPLPSARSVSEAHIRIARLNSIGYPFAVVIGEDGIRAVALGYLPVPETAQLDLPVSEEMRELSAETNSIIEALVPLASHADAIFAGIEEGDGKAISSNAITVDDALLLFDGVEDLDPRVVILEDLMMIASVFLAGSNANTGMSNAGKQALNHASNLALRATHILALAYDRSSSTPWRRVWTDLNFKKWGVVSGVFNEVTKQAFIVASQGVDSIMEALSDAAAKSREMPERARTAFGHDVMNAEDSLNSLAMLFSSEKEK